MKSGFASGSGAARRAGGGTAAVGLCALALAALPLTAARTAPLPSSSVPDTPGEAASPPPAVRDAGSAARHAFHLATLTRLAERAGVPAALADAVAAVESGYDPRAVGAAGEVGLMQVLPATAVMLGFRPDRENLADPETNLRYGVHYLAGAWRLSGGDVCRAVTKYRAGHGEQRITPLSAAYCRRVLLHLAATGSPLAPAVVSASAATPRVESGWQPVPRAGPDRAAPFSAEGSLLQQRAASARRFQEVRDARLRAVREQWLSVAGTAALGLQQRWPGFREPQ